MGLESTERALVLVKAYPQPSQKYEETVCCAGISPAGNFLRIYPVRYRRLPKEKRFERWDVVEFEARRSPDDQRPESRHVNEDTIVIAQPASTIDEAQRVRMWSPHVAESLTALKEENKTTERSLGIVRPDEGSVRFKARRLHKDNPEDGAIQALFKQQSLLDAIALPTLSVEYEFSYRFTSNGTPHEMKIHDWEVQAAHHHYKIKYGEHALEKLQHEYEVNIPSRNLHFVMGTMKAHPRQFIVIGLLRSSISPEDAMRQGSLI